MTNQKGFISIIVPIIMAIVVAGSGIYFYERMQSNTALPESEALSNQEVNENTEVTTTETIETNKKQDDGLVKTDVTIKTDIIETVNCGDENCFEQKFYKCEPATLTADIAFASAYYEIIGPSFGGCKMAFKYTKNPNPEWVNKEMICTFDNKIGFEKSFQNTFNGVVAGSTVCTGPLYTILRSI